MLINNILHVVVEILKKNQRFNGVILKVFREDAIIACQLAYVMSSK